MYHKETFILFFIYYSQKFQSGLTEECRNSKISCEMAEDKLLEFVAQHTEPGKAYFHLL